MPRGTGKSGNRRAKQVEQRAVAVRPRFHDEYQFAYWWWRLLVSACDLADAGGDVIASEVLELGLRVDGGTGEYALGTRGPRLGDDRAPWGSYPLLEWVRRVGLGQDVSDWTPEDDVVPWPRPPPGFQGGLMQRLPRSGVDLRIEAVAGGRLQLRIEGFSVVGHEVLTPIVDEVDWSWPGVSVEQEAVEAQRSAAGAEAFRAMAIETDFFDVGSCSEGDGSSADEPDY